jgi:flagellar motility protein MotE (MotC chaperone)
VSRRFAISRVVLAAALLATSAAAEDAPVEATAKPGVAALLQEMRDRGRELDRRERELDERERSLGELEAEVAALLAELEDVRGTVERRIAAWQEENGDSVRRLAKIYAAMPPLRAARLIEGLELDLATQIVAKMKHKQSAAVLALIRQERALAMSQQVVHPLRGLPAQPAEMAP